MTKVYEGMILAEYLRKYAFLGRDDLFIRIQDRYSLTAGQARKALNLFFGKRP